MPVFIRQGLCMPMSCTQGDYNTMTKKISNKLTKLTDNLVANTGVNQYPAPPDVVIEVSLQKTDQRGDKQSY